MTSEKNLNLLLVYIKRSIERNKEYLERNEHNTLAKEYFEGRLRESENIYELASMFC
jgi:hypothetical protein